MSILQSIRNNATLTDLGVSAKKFKNKLLNYSAIHKEIPENYNPLPIDAVIDYNNNRYEGPQKHICFAPFNSLFFDVRGKVVVCNGNREYVVGDITKDTVKEIWEGDTINKLRQHLDNFDFSLGCSKCADAILSKNYDAAFARSYDSTPTVKSNPVRMEFEISGTCNLACLMCNGFLSSTYRKQIEKQEPYRDVYDESFIDQLEPYLPHLQFTKFSGGEPFLIELYYKIWERMAELNPNCPIHIQTNGLILNNKVKSALEKGKFHIGVSLDGASKENYEKIRMFGKFERVIENLEYFRDYCQRKKTLLNIPFTPTRYTAYEVPEFIRLANQFQATAFFNVVWEPHTLAIWTFDSPELKKLLAFYETQQFEKKTFIELKNHRQFESFKNQVRQWIVNAEVREKVYPEFSSLSNEELIEKLIVRMMEYDNGILANWFTGEVIPDPENHYRKKYREKIDKDPEVMRDTLIRMNTYETERIYLETNVFFHLH